MCDSREYPYSLHGRPFEIPRGRGVLKAKPLEEMYAAKLEFPGGRGGANQKTFRGGNMDVFWNWLFLLEHKLELMFSSTDPCASPIVQVFSPLIDFALALIYMHVIQPPIAGDQSAPSVHVQLARQPISVCYRFACGCALVHFLNSEIFILHFGLQSLSWFPPSHPSPKF